MKERLTEHWTTQTQAQNLFLNSIDKHHSAYGPEASWHAGRIQKSKRCRDSTLILNMAIQHLLQKGMGSNSSYGVITYIDFVTAFDSILHTYPHDQGITRVQCFKEVL